MTYKEFEKKLKELDEGLEFSRNRDWLEVKYADNIIAHIDYKYPYEMDTICTDFDKIVDSKPYAEKLFDLFVELAKTPIDKREEQKKYYVKFSNGYMLSRNWEDNLEYIEIDCPRKNFLENGGWFYYTFTEAEIKAIDPRYWAFAVPVEEEEN